MLLNNSHDPAIGSCVSLAPDGVRDGLHAYISLPKVGTYSRYMYLP